MTLIEAVLATALFGLVAMSILAGINSIWRWQSRQEQTLGAAEVANRLMLIYLDSKDEMPSQMAPVDYGRYRYRWSMRVTGVELAAPAGLELDAARRRSERAERSKLQDRLRHVTIRAWLSEENEGTAGSFRFDDRAPSAVVSRLVDPIATRNPDSLKNVMSDPEKWARMLGDMMGPAPLRPDEGENEEER